MRPNLESLLKLYLVRHGQTEWTLTGQHTGSTNIALTAHGEDEVRELIPCFRHAQFDHVLSSPMQRARRTCELVGLGGEVVTEPDLVECNYGDYEGTLTSDIRQARPDWNVFHDGCPHGEMPTDIETRADRLITRLATLHGNTALFSHGQFLSAFAARWIGLPIAEARHLPLGTASFSIFGYNPAHPDVRVFAAWNATPELFEGARPVEVRP